MARQSDFLASCHCSFAPGPEVSWAVTPALTVPSGIVELWVSAPIFHSTSQPNRSFFAGTVRKKLKLKLVSEKAEGGDRVYRIKADRR